MDLYLKNLYNFDRQLEDGALTATRPEKLKRGGRPDAILVVGMGGSGLAGELLKSLRSTIGLPAPIEIAKGPKLPNLPFKRPLYVFVSFSGNTQEVIDALRETLRKKGREIGIVTTGGGLASIANKKGLPLVTMPQGDLTPREALGYTYSALKKLLLAQFPEIKRFKAPAFRYQLPDRLGKSIARKLKDKTTLLYSREEDAHLTYIWKAALNETGGVPAFRNTFPEVAHNEIVGFESRMSKPTYILFLAPPSFKTDKLSKSLRVFLRIAKSRGIDSGVIPIPGRNAEEVTWSTHLLAHFTAYHLAKISGKNPIKTKLINEFKRQTS